MSKTLGIDLGSNSMGLTLRDSSYKGLNQIIFTSTKIFPEGLKIEKNVPSSKASERTSFRSMRRNYFRKKLRKYNVLKILIENDLCPLKIEELNNWLKPAKNQKTKYPTRYEFKRWLALDFNLDGKPEFKNPYELRNDIFNIDNKIDLELRLGRIFYQFAQRRGFLSNRKNNIESEIDENENLSKLKEKKESEFKQSLNEIDNEIGNLVNEHKTQGILLYSNNTSNLKIRGQVFKRENLIQEFDEIAKFYSNILSTDILHQLRKELFFVRPLKSQKQNVGKCVFEKNKFRCQISRPIFEEFRMYQFVNSIKYSYINDEKALLVPLSEEHRKIVCDLFIIKKDFDFERISKALNKLDKNIKYKFNYKDNFSVSCSPTLASIINVLGKERWYSLKDENLPNGDLERFDEYAKKGEISKEDIWHILNFAENNLDLIRFAKEKLNLDDKLAEKFSKIKLKEGYSNLSKKAITKILPLLKIGLVFSHAVFLANIEDIIGKKIWLENKNPITNKLKDLINGYLEYKKETFLSNSLIKNERTMFNKTPFIKLLTLDELIKEYLKSEFKIEDTLLEKLYHPSQIETFKTITDEKGFEILGNPITSSIKNPVFNRAMSELKKSINYLIKTNQIDKQTKINIEFGRNFNTINKRIAIETYQKKRKTENDGFAKEIAKLYKDECGIEIIPSDEQIDKFRLAKEQGLKCFYTDTPISIAELLNGEKFDIEHTLPRSKTLDNRLVNKTICLADYNRNTKKNQIPSKLNNYNEILDRVDKAYKRKISDLEEKIKKLKINTRNSATKESKDFSIRQRHLLEFDLYYYRAKYKTFIINEIPEGFKLSQSTDITLINKFATQYLKSFFDRVFISSSQILAQLKTTWNLETKDRGSHHHHAVDSLILTLLNNELYNNLANEFHKNEENNKNVVYNFKNPLGIENDILKEFIQNIESNILINHIDKDYTLKTTKKKLRKNGLVQYKTIEGKLTNKPIYQTGSGIRAGLHQQTFYGKIVKDGKDAFVLRQDLNSSNIEKISDLEKIVDEGVRTIVKSTIENYISINNESFKNAIDKSIFWMNEEKGIKITKVRCTTNVQNPIILKEHLIQSPKLNSEYKKNIYVQNDGNYCSIVFEYYDKKKKLQRDSLIVNNFEITKYKKMGMIKYLKANVKELENLSNDEFEIKFVLKKGTKVIFYENSIDEIKWEDNNDLNKRLYIVYSISGNNDKRLYFKIHIEARDDKKLSEDLKNKLGENFEKTLITGKSQFKIQSKYPKLHLSKDNFNFLVENTDFKINEIGQIIKIAK